MFTLETVAAALLDRTVTRRLEFPARLPIVAVGGATLGGSGKTPLAVACAKELAASGALVALVGHAYRAAPRRARVVSPGDSLDEVGDEALLAARALAPSRAHVVVAPSRSEAIAWAARVADVLVLDGVAQLSPSPATLSLLAVDPEYPWGRRRTLPWRGAVRAPVATLLAACDAVVPVGDGPPAMALREIGRSVWPARVDSRGVWLGGGSNEGTLMTWQDVRALRVGLLTALARPERILASLARRGIVPQVIVRARDHGPFTRGDRRRADGAVREQGVDLWLATPKCAVHAASELPALRVGVVDHLVTLHPLLRGRLRALAGRREQPHEQCEQNQQTVSAP